MRENFYIALIKNTVMEIKHKIQTLFHHLSAYISAIHLDSRCIKYTMYIYQEIIKYRLNKLKFIVTTYFVSTRIYVSIKAMAPVHPISAKGLILGSKSLLSPGTMWQTLEKKQCNYTHVLVFHWTTVSFIILYNVWYILPGTISGYESKYWESI